MGKSDMIIEAVISVIQKENFRTMKTAEIAKRAGVAEGTLYRYFKNKKELFIEALKKVISKEIEIIYKGISEEKKIKENINILVNNFYEFKLKGQDYQNFINKAYAEIDDEDIKKILHVELENDLKRLRNILEWGVKKKEISLKSEYIDVITIGFRGMAEYFCKRYSGNDFGEELKKEVEKVGEVFYAMITGIQENKSSKIQ